MGSRFYSKDEIANLCGVSPQAIDKRLKRHGLKPKCQKVSNRLLIPETIATELTSYYGIRLKPGCNLNETSATKFETRFETNETSENGPSLTVPKPVYDDLRKQLEIKDRQIADLSAALAAAQESLKAEQVLHASNQKEILLMSENDDDTDQVVLDHLSWKRRFKAFFTGQI